MSANADIGGTPGSAHRARLASFQARAREGAALNTARYSTFVGFMRYALPAVAALLLGLVVIWPLVSGREDGFRITFSDAEGVDSSLRMRNARFIGTDDQNQPFTITASEASQPEPDSMLVNLTDLNADMFVEKGDTEWLALSANEGTYQREERWLELLGAVTLFSDQGHEFHTEQTHVDLANGVATGDLPLAGQGPLGILDAGNFRFIDSGDTMFFGNGVKVVIHPRR